MGARAPEAPTRTASPIRDKLANGLGAANDKPTVYERRRRRQTGRLTRPRYVGGSVRTAYAKGQSLAECRRPGAPTATICLTHRWSPSSISPTRSKARSHDRLSLEVTGPDEAWPSPARPTIRAEGGTFAGRAPAPRASPQPRQAHPGRRAWGLGRRRRHLCARSPISGASPCPTIACSIARALGADVPMCLAGRTAFMRRDRRSPGAGAAFAVRGDPAGQSSRGIADARGLRGAAGLVLGGSLPCRLLARFCGARCRPRRARQRPRGCRHVAAARRCRGARRPAPQADVRYAAMTGSGATCFALYDTWRRRDGRPRPCRKEWWHHAGEFVSAPA